ncbi:MAG: hypothetical protein DDT38_00456 [Firmicutes bacterium]|nr:hypothetical protein [candidate division NPL-UPA2 bacterium]
MSSDERKQKSRYTLKHHRERVKEDKQEGQQAGMTEGNTLIVVQAKGFWGYFAENENN